MIDFSVKGEFVDTYKCSPFILKLYHRISQTCVFVQEDNDFLGKLKNSYYYFGCCVKMHLSIEVFLLHPY